MAIIGPPSTAKSPAIREGALEPLQQLLGETDMLVSNITTSGLTKLLSSKGKCFVVTPELYDVLNKMLQSEEVNGTGDSQLLCKLFSGERADYNYSSEGLRKIPCNCPFSILWATQVVNMARITCRMDSGHGLVDIFLFCIPPAFRPIPQEQKDSFDAIQHMPIRGLIKRSSLSEKP